MTRKSLLMVTAATALVGCGSRGELKPSEGAARPVAAYGAETPPTAGELLDSGPQARPERSDELLKESREREPDPFDLPPD